MCAWDETEGAHYYTLLQVPSHLERRGHRLSLQCLTGYFYLCVNVFVSSTDVYNLTHAFHNFTSDTLENFVKEHSVTHRSCMSTIKNDLHVKHMFQARMKRSISRKANTETAFSMIGTAVCHLKLIFSHKQQMKLQTNICLTRTIPGMS